MNKERSNLISQLMNFLPRYSREELLAQKLGERARMEAPAPPPTEETELSEISRFPLLDAVMPEMEEPKPVLHIATIEDWRKLRDDLLGLEPLREAARASVRGEAHLNTLDRFENAILKAFARSPTEIDEESTERIVENIVKFLKDYISPLLSYLGAHPDGPGNANLAGTLDAYLARFCIEKHELRLQSSVNEWIDLNIIGGSIITKSTKDTQKSGMIYEITVQPRVIRYLNTFAEIAQQFILGSCCAYKLEG